MKLSARTFSNLRAVHDYPKELMRRLDKHFVGFPVANAFSPTLQTHTTNKNRP